LAKSVYKVNQN